MKVKELIELLQNFDQDLNIIISDGLENRFYHADSLDIRVHQDKQLPDLLDICISDCKLVYEQGEHLTYDW